MRKGTLAVALGVMILLWAAPASAVDAVQCDPLNGLSVVVLDLATGAEIKFPGCFLVENSLPPPLPQTIQVTVPYMTTNASCRSAGDVTLRGNGFTPANSDAGGTLGITIADDMASTVMFTVDPTGFKTVGKGKKSFLVGHFAIPLNCDFDTSTDIPVNLGVNLRVVNR